jgi:hypothetical protein
MCGAGRLRQLRLNGMQPHSLYCWASCSKSVTGTLAAALAHEGLFDPGERISAYLPEKNLSTKGLKKI